MARKRGKRGKQRDGGVKTKTVRSEQKVEEPELTLQQAKGQLYMTLRTPELGIALTLQKTVGVLEWNKLSKEMQDRYLECYKKDVLPGTVIDIQMVAQREFERRHPEGTSGIPYEQQQRELEKIRKAIVQNGVGIKDFSQMSEEQQQFYEKLAKNGGLAFGVLTTMDHLVETELQARHPNVNLADIDPKVLDEEREQIRKEVYERCKNGGVAKEWDKMKKSEQLDLVKKLRNGSVPGIISDRTEIFAKASRAKNDALDALRRIMKEPNADKVLRDFIVDVKGTPEGDYVIEHLEELMETPEGRKILIESGCEVA